MVVSNEPTRRDFLAMSALGLVAGIAPNDLVPSAGKTPSDGSPSPASGSEVSVWVTSGDDRFAAAPHATWAPAPLVGGADRIFLNPATKYQEILGFGGAFTDATCYTLNQLAAPAREQLLHEMFHPSEMGLNVCRTCIGSSDYSTKVYSFDDGDADPSLTRFSIDHDREYILPILRQARQLNPDLFLFSSPWSPPGWMKFNNSMLGGSMRRFYLGAYARYFLKFLQGYAAEGVPIQAVTSQNEVDTDQDGHMPACSWPQEYEIEFVRDHLGPLLESNGITTKAWILDHNYNLWGRVVCSLEDKKLRQYCNSVAWHGYVGTPDMMSRVQDAFPEIGMHWTEGGPDYTDPAYLTDWCKWGDIFTGVLRNWCKSITAWNLALDEHGKPNIGPFSCGGTVTINSQTKDITKSGQYWAFAHYSRVIRRGARRFDTESPPATGLEHIAVENPDGGQVLVVTNPGPARTIELRRANMAAAVPLKADSLTTLTWK
jgi:glucosylceramidase